MCLPLLSFAGDTDCTGIFSAIIVDHADLLTLPTLRATETLGPAGKLQGSETLLLGSIGLDEIGEGKPLLVLDSVLGHAMRLCWSTSASAAAAGWGFSGFAELCC